MLQTDKISAIKELVEKVNSQISDSASHLGLEPHLLKVYVNMGNWVEVYCESRSVISCLDEFFYLAKVIDCSLLVSNCYFIDREDLPCLSFVL